MESIYSKIYRALYGDSNVYQTESAGDMQGWNSNHPSLANNISRLSPELILEIGVWKGASMIHMAKRMPPGSCVLGVDTFMGSQEHWRMKGRIPRDHRGVPRLLDICIANIIGAGVSDRAIPWPVDSRSAIEAMYLWDLRPTMIHLDGGHSYESCMLDLEGLAAIAGKGVIILDDFQHKPIRTACVDFCGLHKCDWRDAGVKGIIEWHGEGPELHGLWDGKKKTPL